MVLCPYVRNLQSAPVLLPGFRTLASRAHVLCIGARNPCPPTEKLAKAGQAWESFCLRFLASFLILVAEVVNGCLDGTQMRPAIVGTARIWRATIAMALLAGKSKIPIFLWFFGSRTLVDREALALPPLTKLHVQTMDQDPNPDLFSHWCQDLNPGLCYSAEASAAIMP